MLMKPSVGLLVGIAGGTVRDLRRGRLGDRRDEPSAHPVLPTPTVQVGVIARSFGRSSVFVERPSCLIPAFDGAFLSPASKAALRAKFLHGSATTTETIRRAIRHSQASLRTLAKRDRPGQENEPAPSRTRPSSASTTRAPTSAAGISPTSSLPTTSPADSRPSKASHPTNSSAMQGLHSPNALG